MKLYHFTGHLSPTPLSLGTIVSPWGMVSAITSRGGERYYLFTDPDDCKDVSLMPADMVERAYAEQQRMVMFMGLSGGE